MRSKTPLVLTEQLIMVLVFAFAAAMCLKLFAVSEQISQRNEAVSQAVLMAQNAAEALKKSEGDAAAVGAGQETVLNEWVYTLKIINEETATEGMGSARIQVTGRKGEAAEELLLELPVAWQEELDHEGR